MKHSSAEDFYREADDWQLNDVLISGRHAQDVLIEFLDQHSYDQIRALTLCFDSLYDAVLDDIEKKSGKKPVISSAEASIRLPCPVRYFIWDDDFKNYALELLHYNDFEGWEKLGHDGKLEKAENIFGKIDEGDFPFHDTSETDFKLPADAVEADVRCDWLIDSVYRTEDLDYAIRLAWADYQHLSLEQAREDPDQPVTDFEICDDDALEHAVKLLDEVVAERKKQDALAESAAHGRS